MILETEFAPGSGVEGDACARLGQAFRGSDDTVEQTIAVLLPDELRTGPLEKRIGAGQFRYCVFSGTPEAPARWPGQGWIAGDSDDLATCVEHAAMSERQVARGTEILERAVQAAAIRLERLSVRRRSNTFDILAGALHQEAGVQTTRMAMAIIANALTFHRSIAGSHGIKPLEDLMLDESLPYLSKRRLCATWGYILHHVNYWPIFRIASDLLRPMPGPEADVVLEVLYDATERLDKIGALGTHDLPGQMFQRLIVDRKFLATFYTLPVSATLLAELSVPRLNARWSDPSSVTRLRLADLACGTGTLLSAAYQSVRRQHRLAGGDDQDLHPGMMESALVAADIMPAATHLTASILSGAHPSVPFGGTRIVTMPYGEQPAESGRPLATGSLDLLEDEMARSLFGTGQEQVRGESKTVGTTSYSVPFPHESGDLLIMNPPFTRPTNHQSTTIPVPSFAGFNTSEDEQRAMSKRLGRLRSALVMPAGHGNAGLASNFIDLAHVKTKPGGVVALVLPASFVQGAAWQGARDLLERFYEDLVVVSIAASGNTGRAFSADTGMAEVLVVATKRPGADVSGAPGAPREDALFVNLMRRPRSLAEASVLARTIRGLPQAKRSGRICLGDQDDAGTFVRATLRHGGCASVREPALAEAMLGLEAGELRLPRLGSGFGLPVTTLGKTGNRGKLHRDIAGKHSDGTPRGPFDILNARAAPLYPVLWSHDAKRERCLVVAPNREGAVREGCREQAADLWQATASRLHFNLDFQINSQSLTACLTPGKSIGGRAWPNFVAKNKGWEKPVALWANSTLGLISFWWLGSRQQQGRAVVTISRLPDLLVLDPGRLSAVQIGAARAAFNRFQDEPMLPANEAYRDPVRQDLDRVLLVDVLGLSPEMLPSLEALRNAWCAEPTVHGGKSTASIPLKG